MTNNRDMFVDPTIDEVKELLFLDNTSNTIVKTKSNNNSSSDNSSSDNSSSDNSSSDNSSSNNSSSQIDTNTGVIYKLSFPKSLGNGNGTIELNRDKYPVKKRI